MRYLKATLLIGIVSAAVVIVLFAAGFIATTPDLLLRDTVYKMPKGTFEVPKGLQMLVVVFLSFALAWTTVDITRPILKTIVAFGAMFLLFSGSWVCAIY